MFVGLISVPLMFAAPVPAAPPVMPPVTTGVPHVYVVPAGTMPFVPSTGATVKELPLQMVEVIVLITGMVTTVTVTVNVLPVHVPEIGVTV
jgi:hypothetical protein